MISEVDNSNIISVENGNNPTISKSANESTKDDPSVPPISTYKFRLEIAVVLAYFALDLSSTIFQNQVIYQTCTAVYSYNRSICLALGTNEASNNSQLKAIENIVQPYSSKIFMAESLVQAIMPALLGLFVGAWSDKYGRKPVMLASLTGYLCFFVIKAIIAGISATKNVNPWIYIVASVPVSLSGGICTWMSAIFCYIADLTTFIERPYKCLMGGLIALGKLFGQLASSYLYEASSATIVFVVSAIAEVLAIVFIVFLIDESVKKDQLSKSSKLKGLIEWGLLRDMLKTVFKRRPHFDRAIIWCIVIALASTVFISSGTDNIFFLFVRARVYWTVKDYTIFNAVSIVVNFVGAVAGIIVLQRLLRFPVTLMALIAFGCYIINTAFYAAAVEPWYLYCGVGLSFLLGVAVPMSRAMLSNTVPLRDIGKVFALTSSLEAIAPLASSPLYTFMYNATLDTYPGAFNLLSCGIDIIAFLLIGFVYVVEFYYPNINREKY